MLKGVGEIKQPFCFVVISLFIYFTICIYLYYTVEVQAFYRFLDILIFP